jgi:hypothetical protein
MYNCVSLAESLVIIELWIITKIPGECGRSTIIYILFIFGDRFIYSTLLNHLILRVGV